MISSSALLTAVILDLMFGDPKWLPHPVRWFGWFITKFETGARATTVPLWISGFLLALLLPSLAFAITWGVIQVAGSIHHELAWVAEVIVLYQCISIRGLYDETKPVYQALMRNDMFDARKYLSMVVGRDTQKLNSTDISRAVTETVAEGTVDGIVSPLFFAALGGAPLAMAFKAVSTLDSMVGYKNETYVQFGCASARLDDLLNYIPARLSVLFVPLAAWICRLNATQSFVVVVRDRLLHSSPNAGHAEAAFAGALDVQMGGTNYYHGVKSEKPVIHPNGKQVDRDDIPKAWKLMVFTSLLFLILFLGIKAVI